jgi:hypothetical protein
MSAFGGKADIACPFAVMHKAAALRKKCWIAVKLTRWAKGLLNGVSFGEPPSLTDQNRIVVRFIIADE